MLNETQIIEKTTITYINSHQFISLLLERQSHWQSIRRRF